MSKKDIKTFTIPITTARGRKQLQKLLSDGWVIVSEHKRGMFEWKPGQVDYVMRKSS